MNTSGTWLLKDEQGNQFGPVVWESLLGWASDGRIGPSDQISPDGTHWRNAADIAELQMEWLVELSPGNYYGPITRNAAEGLIRNGNVPASASVYHRLSPDARTEVEAHRHEMDRAVILLNDLRRQLADVQANFVAQEQTAKKQAEELARSAEREKKMEQELLTASAQLSAQRQQLTSALQQQQLAQRKSLTVQAELENMKDILQRAKEQERANAADAEDARNQAREAEQKLASSLMLNESLQQEIHSLQKIQLDLQRETELARKQIETENLARETLCQEKDRVIEALRREKEDAEERTRELEAELEKRKSLNEEQTVEVVEAEIITPQSEPYRQQTPPSPTQTSVPFQPGQQQQQTLAALEAQVQRELAAMRASGQMASFLKK
ncbi:MAG: hypothetical protein IKR48_13460 [Kiritimatiellae bacterium]|nr:hypothetical protein [Kiritimatiellia bacterium]